MDAIFESYKASLISEASVNYNIKQFTDAFNHVDDALDLKDFYGHAVNKSQLFKVMLKLIKKNGWTNDTRRPKDSSITPRACFYNALDYVHEHPEADLAWGVYSKFESGMYLVRNSKLGPFDMMGSDRLDMVKHAFCVQNKTILDPTLGNGWYCYEIVPKKVWEKFNYIPDDDEFDATDFVKYINKRIKAL